MSWSERLLGGCPALPSAPSQAFFLKCPFSYNPLHSSAGSLMPEQVGRRPRPVHPWGQEAVPCSDERQQPYKARGVAVGLTEATFRWWPKARATEAGSNDGHQIQVPSLWVSELVLRDGPVSCQVAGPSRVPFPTTWIGSKRRKGRQRMRWLETMITDSVDMRLSKPQETVEDRGDRWATAHGAAKSWTQLSDWTTTRLGAKQGNLQVEKDSKP